MISDTFTDTFVTSIARPNILFVAQDPDHDGWLLKKDENLRETDPQNFRLLTVKVDSISADSAVLKITYNSNGKPDPSIGPWSGARTYWQSPDIEVRNPRNDPSTGNPGFYFNTPWLGHSNKIIAKIANSGDRAASDVTAVFFVTEFTTGEGPRESLGEVTKDIDFGVTEEFEVEWAPPSAEGRHYGIIVSIEHYQDPRDPTVEETSIFNNQARSNYMAFISASASPSERVLAEVKLSDPFKQDGIVHTEVSGWRWAHRLFTEHRWLKVPAKSEKAIKVWEECIIGTKG